MKVLITPLFGLGDTLMFTPALEILKMNRPDWTIDVFTFKRSNYEILIDNPYIDNLIFEPMLTWNKLKVIGYMLKSLRGKYDVVINFYPSNRKDYNIFAFLTGARYRLGHRYLDMNFKEWNFLKNLTIDESTQMHCVEQNIRLLELLGINNNMNEIPDMKVYLSDEEVEKGEIYLKQWDSIKIGLHTGTSRFKNHINRRWPKEYFLEIVNYFKEVKFLLFGTDEEKEENEYILKNNKNDNVILVENKTIREVAAIVKNLDLFISNDSGLMHLSAAVGTKTFGIFGPTNPIWVKPWGDRNTFFKLDLPCSPCFVYSPKPLNCKIDDRFKCLKELKPDIIIKKIKEVL